MGDETEVIDVEVYGVEGLGVRGGLGEVGVVALDGVDEVGDAETPKEGGEATAFRDVFEGLDIGVIVGEAVEDTVHEGVVESADSLPEVKGDVILM